MPSTRSSEASLGLLIGTAAILFTAFILALMWQSVFGWLLFMLLLLAIANTLHNAVRLSAYGSLTGRVIASATASLRDGIACVTLGVAIVVAAQLVLWIVDHVSPAAVRAAEVWLSSARGAMERVISLRNLLIALAVATVLALLIPQSWALSRFSRARDLAAAVYLMLLTVTSFTFFSGLGIANGEMTWNAKLRSDMNEALAERDRTFAEAAGAAWTEQKLRELTEDERTAIQAFFVLTPEEVRRKLPRVKANLAYAAEGVDRAERPARNASAAEQRFRSHSSRGPETSSGYPTMSELSALAREAEAETFRHRTVREAAATAAAAAMSELVPGLDGGIARELVKSLAESVGAKIAEAAMPDVATLDKLRDWVRGVLRGRGGAGKAAPPDNAAKPAIRTLDQFRDALRGAPDPSAAAPGKAAAWTWQRDDFELDQGQLSRRVARDLAWARKSLQDARDKAASQIEPMDGIPAGKDERRRPLSESFDEIEAMLERLVAEAPASSAEITRLGTEISRGLHVRDGRGSIIRGPILEAPEPKPRPAIRGK